MKHLIFATVLAAVLASPAWADEETTAAGDSSTAASTAASDSGSATKTSESDSKGFHMKIDLGDDEDKKDTDTDKDVSKEEVRQHVLNFVDKILKDTDVEMSDKDKDELRNEIRKEIKGARVRDNGPTDLQAVMGIAVGALAVVLIFGTPVFIVAFVLYASYRKRRLVHDTINSYVATGKEIPPEVLQTFHQEAAPKNNLQRGLVMVGVGLGIIVCFEAIGAGPAAAFGAIPLFIGLAQLLIWKLEKNGGKSGN